MEGVGLGKDSSMERFYDCTNCMKTFKVSSVTEPSAEIPETKVSVQLATHQTLLLCRREPSFFVTPPN